jgi:hypothetical protein
VSTVGALLQRPSSDKPWKLIKPKEAVYSRDTLLALPGSRAEVDTKSEGVRLTLAGNLPDLALVPLYESAVVLHATKDYDLDFTLDRGRVLISNRKARGAVLVRVQFEDESWNLILEKGSEVALERFGRWLRTPSSIPKLGKNDQPDSNLLLFVLKGDVVLKENFARYALNAPPGAALFTWSSRRGTAGPHNLKKLPPWALPEAARSDQAKAAARRVERLRRALEKKDLNAALEDTLQANAEANRVLAVFSLAAMEEIPAVVAALEDKKHRDVRLTAIEGLRHYLGRSRDNVAELFHFLRQKKFTPAHATITIQLLNSFSDRELARPETYALLIEYLRHDRVAIRELADWHLRRLAPEAPKYKYDPAGSDAQLKKAQAEWKKLIPEGQVPQRKKPKT